MKQLFMVKKTVETLEIWEESGRIPPIGRKGPCKIKMTEGYTEGFRNFWKQATKVYEVIFFDV